MKVVKLHVAGGVHPSRRLRIWWWLFGLGGEYKIATKWNDLEWRQVKEVAGLIFSNYNIYMLKLLLVKAIGRIPMIAFKWLSDEDKLYLTDQVNWATSLEKLNLTKNLLPYYKELAGPDDKLGNITIDEFGFADRCFGKYLDTKRIEELNRLVAILYRKRKKGEVTDGDVRVAFNHHVIERDALVVAKWNNDVKHAILLWFWGCRNLIVNVHKEKFKVPTGGGAGTGKGADWFDIISSMSGGKFGTIEETKKVNVWVFMREWSKKQQ